MGKYLLLLVLNLLLFIFSGRLLSLCDSVSLAETQLLFPVSWSMPTPETSLIPPSLDSGLFHIVFKNLVDTGLSEEVQASSKRQSKSVSRFTKPMGVKIRKLSRGVIVPQTEQIIKDKFLFCFYYRLLATRLRSGGFTLKHAPEIIWRDFASGLVVQNPPANVGDTSSIPGPGGSHMIWGNKARVPQLLSPHSTASKLKLLSLCATATESCSPRTHAL